MASNEPPPRLVNPWVEARHGPLSLPHNLNAMPNSYLKLFPKFKGDGSLTEYHLIAFQDFTDNFFIEFDDVFMRLFVETL